MKDLANEMNTERYRLREYLNMVRGQGVMTVPVYDFVQVPMRDMLFDQLRTMLKEEVR